MAGCGSTGGALTETSPAASTSQAASEAAALPDGFLSTGPGWAFFLQWTRNGNALVGTMSMTYVAEASSGEPQATGASVGFSGVVSGSSVTLTLDQQLFGGSA